MNTKKHRICENCWWYNFPREECGRVSTKHFFMLSGDYCSKWLQKHLPSGEFIGFKIEDLTKAQVGHLEDRIESLEEKIESLTETNYSITRSLSDLSTRIFKAKARELRLLKVLECYADDGDAGPGSPVLPARDVKLRGFAVSLIHEIEGDKK